MPHATEGDLHAWLDGALSVIDPEGARRLSAHLDRCADCAARLEEERAIRGRANELLGVALPAQTPPPFAEIGGATSSTRSGRGPERFAWAAGIVLALGAGWMGHALLRETGDPLETAMRARGDAVTAQTEAPADEGARLGDSDALERDVPAENEAGRLERTAGAGETEPPEEPAAPPAGARRQAGRQVVGAADVVTGEDADRAASEVAARDRPAALQELSALAVESSANEAFDEQPLDVSDAEWRSTDLEEATAWAGRDLIVVPDLDIVDIAVADPAGDRLVRVRQALEDGVLIELIARVGASLDDLRYAGGEPTAERESVRASEPVAAAPVPAARTRDEASKAVGAPAVLRRVIDGIPVIASARLAPDSLAALLSRARPPER